MDWVNIAFWIFAAMAAVAAGAVISVRNPVHAVLCLILTFFSVACIWLLVGAEFLGVALILVYVGAVMVLFLFVVMMLDIDVAKMREGWVKFLPVGVVVAVAMLVQMLTLIGVKARTAAAFPDNAAAAAADVSNTAWLARSLFTEFLLPFEFAAVILTVAVVAAVMLTLRRRAGAKHQDPSEQSRVKAGDRIRMVKMAAEKPVRASADEAAEGEGKA
ncbi:MULTISPECIES: NADH-quinone oxidoreductase subunit J [Pseudoxanthomonas]|jgi:NADH-quinone oxidoreductase subunit J|uniref:NADH-quinone oxidoreductase subunit J n=1 Tax=Pseudoxanthomonas TaxID=83618 RepID=UPI001616E6BA|nr:MULTISPECIES: NADH-quinone oxidoreductase subunit J [Pseudoxanthomonas]MBB3277170.1 NADH-quinone oxidoreductase subunit J [Pseudoxanthomonas sp. OG2]MBD9376520.1 NADH-quinone oxidoreductase subunit J [Pseudoxanthomonas sp. PXM04]MBV7475540.1 NADH-quinone oxidoreductase subunit J [Pseudoxanthomonas sp. PXM05]UBB26479.1 NADH-quinone oxidoreductase subunit J [Pseudoxanthomonas japonensis]